MDPLKNYKFLLEIDGVAEAGFSEALIPEGRVEVIEYREGSDPGSASRKLPGPLVFEDAVLVKGVTDSKVLYDWWKQVMTGDLANVRRNVKIIIQDDSGMPQASWILINAWPAAYSTTPLDAQGNVVFVEKLELAVERVERA
jgi:phage tail-like protein